MNVYRWLLSSLLWLGISEYLQAGPTNAILFVTQVPIPADFTTIGSVFGNHKSSLDSCGRGGDLYIRYPDGTVKNLTRAAGFGAWGKQGTIGISVRQPCMHWNGQKAVFSMVVGGPKAQYDTSDTGVWQLYEITGFVKPTDTPVITKVAHQPEHFNNISPLYGTDDRILFTSDRPRNGAAHLYPQLDEYEEAPTVTGIWSLDPSSGDLFLLNHTPSGAFTPQLDSAGRVIFTRWDHLQRDQQADADAGSAQPVYGTFNYSDESANSVATTQRTEVFPEPRGGRTDLLAGTGLTGHTFNQFFPWQIHEDGQEEETLNHVGRHELGGSYVNGAFNNDPNIQDLYYFGNHFNTNTIRNLIQMREDPRNPGLFYGIDAPEFGTHASGQLISLTGNRSLNANAMQVRYLTPLSTRSPASSAKDIPKDHTGFYRNPLMTTDGFMIASHTAWALEEQNSGSTALPTSKYDFRLKILTESGGIYKPAEFLTSGLTNRAAYWNPDTLVTHTQLLWELDPVEVVARTRPARLTPTIEAPEHAAFESAAVDPEAFRDYLKLHQLALVVSRDVTTRDHADHQQPYNLRVEGTAHASIGSPGKIYDVAWLQFFQADQIRGLNFGNPSTPRAGRRVLAQVLHDPAVDLPPAPSFLPGSVSVAPDGSQAALVPARRAMTWQLTDSKGEGVVRERYWLSFAPGEIRSCTSCHGINQTTQTGAPVPTNSPAALVELLRYWKTQNTLQLSVSASSSPQSLQIRWLHRPQESEIHYHVESSTDLREWKDLAHYVGTQSELAPEVVEESKEGSPTEAVTLRYTPSSTGAAGQFLRIRTSRSE